MTVTVLAENTTSSDCLKSEHGLSLYITTAGHKLLFDTGASGLFAENAEKLGIDLRDVDLAVISHGHYDHGGGLRRFLEINPTAKIYLHNKAFDKHYADRPSGIKADIGLDTSLLPNDRFAFCGDDTVLDDELMLFSGIRGRRFFPSGNSSLFMEADGVLVGDDFSHEQNLIIREGGKTVLIAGCAHNGLVNIIDHFAAKEGRLPDYVIGGFHLTNPAFSQNEDPNTVDALGRFLLGMNTRFFTCHCTGLESYRRLKTVMGDHIDYLATGSRLTI